MSYRINVLKRTEDNWYGNYVLNGYYEGVKNPSFVEVTFSSNISIPGSLPISRVCVWGNDDMGLEYDTENETEAHTLFLQVIGMEYVEQTALRKLGFVSA